MGRMLAHPFLCSSHTPLTVGDPASLCQKFWCLSPWVDSKTWNCFSARKSLKITEIQRIKWLQQAMTSTVSHREQWRLGLLCQWRPLHGALATRLGQWLGHKVVRQWPWGHRAMGSWHDRRRNEHTVFQKQIPSLQNAAEEISSFSLLKTMRPAEWKDVRYYYSINYFIPV